MSGAPVELAVRTLFERGNACLVAGDVAGAEQCYREALALDDDVAELHAGLASLQQDRGEDAAAEASYRRAIELQPTRVAHRTNFASLLMAQRRIAEAEACLRAAIDLDPQSRAAWMNLGVLLASVKRDDEAARCLDQAIAIDPHDLRARFNTSYLLLRQGRYDEGWAALETRDWYGALERRLNLPRWNGEDLQGRTLLIGFEAGHGDVIQFARYAAVLKARGAATVGLICHPALKRLFATLPGVDLLIGFDEPLPERSWDFWTPLFSIAFHCRTTLDSIPVAIPYLQASQADIDRIAVQLPAREPHERRIGLVWRGSASFENDAERSLPSLSMLALFATVQGVHWVSLQKGPGESEADDPPAGLRITPLGGHLRDFADTAAAIARLDLVIAVDTAVAHLAGAMGRPCFVLLPFHRTDWRWLDDRSDSPWYPIGMRLFRQPAIGEWSPVIEAVVAAVREMISPSD